MRNPSTDKCLLPGPLTSVHTTAETGLSTNILCFDESYLDLLNRES